MNETPKSGFQQAEALLTPESEKVITVEVIKPVNLDGKPMSIGVQTKVSLKQWRALSRHFKWIDGPAGHDPADKSFAEKREKTVDAREKALAKAAALAILILGLFLPGTAKAVGPPSQFGSLPLPPMLALLPTNGLQWTAGASVGVATASTNTWTVLTNLLGEPTNVIAVTKFDEIYVTLTGGNQAASGGFTNTFVFWQGDGTLANWDTNHPFATLTLSTVSGTNAVLCTNFSRNLLGSAADLVVGQIQNVTGALASTNLAIKIQVKPIRSGN